MCMPKRAVHLVLCWQFFLKSNLVYSCLSPNARWVIHQAKPWHLYIPWYTPPLALAHEATQRTFPPWFPCASSLYSQLTTQTKLSKFWRSPGHPLRCHGIASPKDTVCLSQLVAGTHPGGVSKKWDHAICRPATKNSVQRLRVFSDFWLHCRRWGRLGSWSHFHNSSTNPARKLYTYILYIYIIIHITSHNITMQCHLNMPKPSPNSLKVSPQPPELEFLPPVPPVAPPVPPAAPPISPPQQGDLPGSLAVDVGWCRLKMLKLLCWQKRKHKNVADLHHSNIVQTEFMNSDHVEIIPSISLWMFIVMRIWQFAARINCLGGKAQMFVRLCHSMSHDSELDNSWSWNKIKAVSTGLSGILYSHVENMQHIISYSSLNERWGAWRQDKSSLI